MPTIETTVRCPVHKSFRVEQVAGMFDVPLGEEASETFAVDVPGLEEDWQIGAIVGPSGSGKNTVAAAAFESSVSEVEAPEEWPAEATVIDGFGGHSAKKITAV